MSKSNYERNIGIDLENDIKITNVKYRQFMRIYKHLLRWH
jgi:hypothetical protein